MAKYKLRWPITRDECDECGHTSTRLRRPWRKVWPTRSLDSGTAAIMAHARRTMEHNAPCVELFEQMELEERAKTVAIPRVGGLD